MFCGIYIKHIRLGSPTELHVINRELKPIITKKWFLKHTNWNTSIKFFMNDPCREYHNMSQYFISKITSLHESIIHKAIKLSILLRKTIKLPSIHGISTFGVKEYTKIVLPTFGSFNIFFLHEFQKLKLKV